MAEEDKGIINISTSVRFADLQCDVVCITKCIRAPIVCFPCAWWIFEEVPSESCGSRDAIDGDDDDDAEFAFCSRIGHF